MTQTVMGPPEAIAFLHECARYFERRDTKGEDRAHWSNVYNAANCRNIATLISALADPSSPMGETMNPQEPTAPASPASDQEQAL